MIKGGSRTHQHNSSHSLQSILGLQRHNPLKNNQAAYFFLLMEKKKKKSPMRSSCSFNDVNWSPPTAAPPPPFHCVRLPARPFLFFVGQMNLLHSQNQKEKKYLWNMVWKWFADFSFLLLWLPQLWGFFFLLFADGLIASVTTSIHLFFWGFFFINI